MTLKDGLVFFCRQFQWQCGAICASYPAALLRAFHIRGSISKVWFRVGNTFARDTVWVPLNLADPWYGVLCQEWESLVRNPWCKLSRLCLPPGQDHQKQFHIMGMREEINATVKTLKDKRVIASIVFLFNSPVCSYRNQVDPDGWWSANDHKQTKSRP